MDLSKWSRYEDCEDGIYIADTENYNLKYMNRKLRDMLGMTDDSYVDKKCYEVLQGFAAPCAMCTNCKLAVGKDYKWDYYNQIAHAPFRLNDTLIEDGNSLYRKETIKEYNDENDMRFKGLSRETILVNEALRMSLEESDADVSILRILEYVGQALGAQRAYVFEIRDTEYQDNTYEWCAANVTPEKDFLQDVPLEATAVWFEEFKKNRYIIIEDLDLIKETDPAVYVYLEPQNIHSIVVCPLYDKDRLIGYYGFDNPPMERMTNIANILKTIGHFIEALIMRRNLVRNLTTLSFKDPLTGLKNRHAADEFFKNTDKDKSIGLAFCDVCGLKNLNDTKGHAEGDKLLLRVRDTLLDVFDTENVFRIGGDEFIVIMNGVEEKEFREKCNLLRDNSYKNDAPLAVGVCFDTEISIDMEEILKRADAKMYTDKRRYYDFLNAENHIGSENQVEELSWLENQPTPAFVYKVDGPGEIIYANQRFFYLYDCRDWKEYVDLKKDSTVRGVIHPDDFDRILSEIREKSKNDKFRVSRNQYRIINKNGDLVYIDDIGKAIYDPKYGMIVYVYMFDKSLQINRFADDKQTLLPGTQRFFDYTNGVLEEDDVKFDLVYYNIRHFKLYNSKFGDEKGDDLLFELSKILTKTFESDYVARFTDDHFVVLSKSDNVEELVEKSIDLFDKQYDIYQVNLKAGIFHVNNNELSAHQIIDCAKESCDSIRFSADKLNVYDDKLEKKLLIKNYIPQMFDTAMEQGWIKVYYQPVIRTVTGKLCGLEGLARWIDPIHGFMNPGEFIPILEENHMIHKLDLRMIEEHFKLLRNTENVGRPVIPVSFNLSRLDFFECDIYAEIEKLVEYYNVDRRLINLEVTESVMIENDHVKTIVDKFRARGYEVWMDDFGSGYSSLNVLKDSHFDELKLDMQFLKDLNEKGKSIIESILYMAKRIGIHTLAEGVETIEQFEYLKSIGCEKVQGYLFGKPDTIYNTVVNCLKSGTEIESAEWENYYNTIGQVNLISTRAIGVSEFDGDNGFKFLFVNKHFEHVCLRAGLKDMDEFYEKVREDSPLKEKFKEFQNSLKEVGDRGQIDYTIDGVRFRLKIEKLCSYKNKSVSKIELMNLSDEQYVIPSEVENHNVEISR